MTRFFTIGISCAAVLSFALCSCGRIGYDPNSGQDSLDAAITDGSVLDAPVSDGAEADELVLSAFGVPVAVDSLNSLSRDDDPTLTADRLLILFASGRSGGTGALNLWTSTRKSIDLPWDPPVPVAELNTTNLESGPKLSRDGLTLHYTSKITDPRGDIYVSSRADRSDPWGPPALVSELNSVSADGSASTDSSQSVMIFNSDRGGSVDLFESRRATPTIAWQQPQLVVELMSSGTDATPVLLGDGLVVYFSSDGIGGAGGRDLFRASRVSLEASFSPPTPITELNTSEADTDPWVSDDEQTIFFSQGGAFGDNIYMAQR